MNNNNLYSCVSIILFVTSMIFLSYASAPLYKLFCSQTGFGGYTKSSKDVGYASTKGKDTIRVFFDANIEKKLSWNFYPMQRYVDIKPGQNVVIFYKAKNLTNKPLKGIAVYNVNPDVAGEFFVKIHCFCFDEQTLEPNQEVDMPVTFYIDPKIESDINTKNIKQITLSYTFFSQEN
jgi:cytochrome c oxidase assembly protein subunit 11